MERNGSARNRLHSVIAELGIEAKKSLGQNFLVSDAVIEKIIAEVINLHPQRLLEVGPGAGALTFFLRQLDLPLQVIELDRQFSKYWRDQGLEVIEADALVISWEPLLAGESDCLLVSNLPYQISSSLVIDRCLDSKGLVAMILMFQKEVAQRIRSRPRDKNYGLLTVIAQSFWHIDTVCEAGPRDFWPVPNVASRVLRFRRKNSPIVDRQKYLKLIKACFSQRRKLMKTNLRDLFHRFPEIESRFNHWIVRKSLSEKVRAEELAIGDFEELFFALYPDSMGSPPRGETDK